MTVPDNARAKTFFFLTPRFSPSSLAFFVSGFNETLQETRRGINHIVSARETETDYTEKLFQMTESLVQAVESFMRVELPHLVLHSVAIPNYKYDVGSFYGFNYYRQVYLAQ